MKKYFVLAIMAVLLIVFMQLGCQNQPDPIKFVLIWNHAISPSGICYEFGYLEGHSAVNVFSKVDNIYCNK